jgi:hypothetical protein
MTLKEVCEIYGGVPLKFTYYYKYVFNFVGIAEDGTKIEICIGGHPEDIYRFTVHHNSVEYLKDENYAKNDIDNIYISKNGQIIFKYNNG